MKVGDSLEMPALNETRKVKSIQMFRVRSKLCLQIVKLLFLSNVQVSVDKIHGGDRAGICVTQFDPKLLERGLVRPWLHLCLSVSVFLSRFAHLEVFPAPGQCLPQWKGFNFSRERFAKQTKRSKVEHKTVPR